MPLTWGTPAEDITTQLTPEVLPPGAMPDVGISLGEGASSPLVQPVAAAGGQGDMGASSGEVTWGQQLSPSQQQTVSAFFDAAGEQRP